MMLLARLIKSSGALIGIGIGLFIVFDFFWGIILTLLFALTHTPYDSLAYYEYSVIAEFLNPAQFVGLVDTFLTHQATATGFGGGFNFPISPAQYGITISSIIATGIIWVVVPLAAFLYLAIKKD
jgi:ABC-type antimicrobial peptide transport system permease subunit